MADRYGSGGARWLGVLRLSRRQLQQRWLESALIVLGIALGVGVLTAGETFVRFQNRMMVELVAGQLREWQAITVQPLSSGAADAFYGSDAVPAVRIALQDLEQPVRFTIGDLMSMRRDVPGVKYVTSQDNSTAMDIVAVDDVELEPVFHDLLSSVGGADDTEADIVPSTDHFTRPVFPMLLLNLVTPDEFGALGYDFVAGGPFTWADFDEGGKRIVLERGSAEQLFPGMDVVDMIGRTVTTMERGPGATGDQFNVVGILEFPEQARLMVGMVVSNEERTTVLGYAPLTAGRRDQIVPPGGTGDSLTFTRLFLTPENDGIIPEITSAAQVYFDQKYGAGRVELRNPEAERQSGLEELASTVVALLVLAGLGLIIAAVNVLNLFTARVLRRMRITGMSVALGATRRLLFWQTAGEALLLGASGSILGIGMASGLISGVRALLTAQRDDIPVGLNMFADLKLGLPDVAIGLVAGVGLSLVFGLYPAWLGSRQDPVEALRVEG